MLSLVWLFLVAGILVSLAYRRTSLAYASLVLGALLVALYTPFALLNVTPLRLSFVTRPFLRIYRRMLPSMSTTEREALEAGTVWWDGELFSGNPDWSKLRGSAPAKLTADEQAFVDGPCEDLCRMVDDWDATHRRADLAP